MADLWRAQVGERLRAARAERGVGMKAMMDALGVSKSTLADIESGCFTEMPEDWDSLGGHRPDAFPLDVFVAHAYDVIAANGWVSRRDAREGLRAASADLAAMTS